MNHYGICAKICGVPCGLILRDHAENGRYKAVFEREYASIEAIEAIDWSRPEVEVLRAPAVLPEGYGFEVVRITYDSAIKAYSVELKTAVQYWGDVTGYQAAVTDLTEQAEAARQEAEILRQAAEDWSTALAEAYREGVESNG